MPKIDEAFQEKVKAVILERKAVKPCPCCGSKDFTFLNGVDFSQRIEELPVTGQNGMVPFATVACVNCGWMRNHAIGILGLMSEIEVTEDEANIETQS